MRRAARTRGALVQGNRARDRCADRDGDVTSVARPKVVDRSCHDGRATMNTRYECDRQLLVQADFDGELDAARAADLLSHRATCVHCQAAALRLARARTVV